MPYRRRSFQSPKITRAAAATCEALEQRQMLTSVVHGLFTNTVVPGTTNPTIYEGGNVFQYKQANGNATIRIVVTGDLTAEFIGAQYNPLSFDGSQVTLTDLVPDTVPNATAGAFLFNIYVLHSDANCSISISQINNNGRMTPFVNGIGMRITPANGAATVVVTPSDGGAYLGAETLNNLTAPANSIPLIYSNQRGFGLRPSSAGRILSGLVVSQGNDFDKFFFGGTVTGYVSIGGNIDTFYAGNILTGDASGISTFGSTSDLNFQNIAASAFVQRNFHVDGDIQHLISANSFGTLSVNNLAAGALAGDFENIQYKTGFQLDVNGRASNIHGDDSFLGEATIHDLTTVTGTGIAQHELEFRGAALPANGASSYFDPLVVGNDISLGDLQADARFNNDTFATAQYMGTLRSQELRDSNVIQLKGSLGNSTALTAVGLTDAVDYYAFGLLAGQSVSIQLLDSITSLIGENATQHPRIGIFDPNGRLIATDYSDFSTTARLNKPIQIKATIPGAYRIAVGFFGDVNFNGVIDAATATTAAETFVTNLVPKNYQIRVTQVGDISLGGLTVNQHVATLDAGAVGIQVLHGDVGAIRAGAQIFSSSNPWYVPSGNLRSMEAVSMGLSNNGGNIFDPESGPDLLIRKGSIGLLHTTGASIAAGNANYLSINDDTLIYPTSDDSLDLTSPTLAVGTNIQLVDCAGVLEGDYLANAAIGVIRAQIIGGFHGSTPIIQANVNNVGSDGIIDLIDVTTTSTTVAAVDGLAITTGDGGNVRYFHIQPTAFVNSDPFFGNGLDAERTFAPGEATTVVDDSGARMVLTPLPQDPNPTFPANPNALSSFLDPPVLSLLTYPVRGKTGVVLMRVTVTPVDDTTDGLVRPGGGGLMVQSTSTNGRAEAEISDIDLNRVPDGVVAAGGFTGGDPFTFQPFTLAPFNRIYTLTDQSTSTNPIRDQNLIFQGSSPINIWNITAFTAGMNISLISNSTTGEIVNMSGATNAVVGPNIFNMTAENIGVAVSHTGTAVEGGTPVTGAVAALPFAVNTPAGAGQRNMINVGNVNSMLARQAIGNVTATNIATIGANSDGKNVPGVFEGIVGPIVSRGATTTTGNIVHAAIGEGITSSGNGSFARSGIFADGIIDSVTGTGDIRGDVVALASTPFTAQAAVNPLTGAAIFLPDGITQATQRTPTYFIGSIKLSGGSIIDANVGAFSGTGTNGGITSIGYGTALEFPSTTLLTNGPAHTAANPGDFIELGSIRLDGTGGIIGSNIEAADIGSVAVNGGFGIVNSHFLTVGAGTIQAIATDGFGIRGSSFISGNINSVTARGTGRHTPTSFFSPSVRISESSSFDPYSGLTLDAFNDLDKAMGTTAAKPFNGTNTDTGLIQDSQFTGGGKIGKVDAFRIYARYVMQTDPITRLTSRIPYGSPSYPMRISFAGGAGTIVAHDQVNGLALVTGKLDSFAVGGNVQNTAINVGSLIGSISAGGLLGTTSIKMTSPGGVLKSLSTLHSLFATVVISQDIQSIKVGTDIGSPNIFSGRNVGSISVAGNVLSGAKIRVAKTLSSLAIGGDVKVNSSITAGAIQKQIIKGQVLGDIIIT